MPAFEGEAIEIPRLRIVDSGGVEYGLHKADFAGRWKTDKTVPLLRSLLPHQGRANKRGVPGVASWGRGLFRCGFPNRGFSCVDFPRWLPVCSLYMIIDLQKLKI
jgi:hypothetical protein